MTPDEYHLDAEWAALEEQIFQAKQDYADAEDAQDVSGRTGETAHRMEMARRLVAHLHSQLAAREVIISDPGWTPPWALRWVDATTRVHL